MVSSDTSSLFHLKTQTSGDRRNAPIEYFSCHSSCLSTILVLGRCLDMRLARTSTEAVQTIRPDAPVLAHLRVGLLRALKGHLTQQRHDHVHMAHACAVQCRGWIHWWGCRLSACATCAAAANKLMDPNRQSRVLFTVSPNPFGLGRHARSVADKTLTN